MGCALPVGSDGEPIIGGNVDDGHDQAVVLVQLKAANGDGFICTGTLITPRIVLLAAHCVDNTPAITSSRVVFADSWDTLVDVYSGKLDPEFLATSLTWVDPLYSSSTSGTTHDLALLYLAGAPPPQAHPVPIYRQRLGNDIIGQSDRFIGYGLRSATSESSVFERIYAIHSIDRLTAMEIGWDGGSTTTCSGDSGGPHLVTLGGVEQIVAVTSFGDEHCAAQAFAQRVDAALPGILQFIADHDPQPSANCGADGICGWACADIDPDCPCVSDGRCTAACANPDADPDCPLHCGADHTCQRTGCPVPDPDCGDLPTGAVCIDVDECLSGLCVPDATGTKICTQACDAGGGCPSNFKCDPFTNACLPFADRGCAVGGGSGGAWLVALLLLRLPRRPARRQLARDTSALASFTLRASRKALTSSVRRKIRSTGMARSPKTAGPRQAARSSSDLPRSVSSMKT